MKSNSPIDDLIRQTLKAEKLDMPSDEFSNKVMNAISETSVKIVYRPLLPKVVLLLIPILIVLCIAAALVFQGSLFSNTYTYIDKVFNKAAAFNFLKSAPDFIMYCITGTLILLFIQSAFLARVYQHLFIGNRTKH